MESTRYAITDIFNYKSVQHIREGPTPSDNGLILGDTAQFNRPQLYGLTAANSRFSDVKMIRIAF